MIRGNRILSQNKNASEVDASSAPSKPHSNFVCSRFCRGAEAASLRTAEKSAMTLSLQDMGIYVDFFKGLILNHVVLVSVARRWDQSGLSRGLPRTGHHAALHRSSPEFDNLVISNVGGPREAPPTAAGLNGASPEHSCSGVVRHRVLAF